MIDSIYFTRVRVIPCTTSFINFFVDVHCHSDVVAREGLEPPCPKAVRPKRTAAAITPPSRRLLVGMDGLEPSRELTRSVLSGVRLPFRHMPYCFMVASVRFELTISVL